MAKQNTLIWLPSPMGDAILCTPALRAIRRRYPDNTIWFYTSNVVRDVLSPSHFNDKWLEQTSNNPLNLASEFKKYKFDRVILFKNSFMSALTVFLARIPERIGYTREWRGIFLSEKLEPPRLPDGKYKPTSMLDYYLALAAKIGADTADRAPQLEVSQADVQSLKEKLPEIFLTDGPLVVLVPGGAFGPNKCWPAEYFARTADWLAEKYEATVIVSVAPNIFEQGVGESVCKATKHRLINLGETPLTLGELKALFAAAELVIANDTGPRHIAIALKKKIITLFGPNDPEWTQTGWPDEIQIVANVECAPCQKPQCQFEKIWCMHSIGVETVCEAADKVLAKWQAPTR
jgi:heptosyltransferase-2